MERGLSARAASVQGCRALPADGAAASLPSTRLLRRAARHGKLLGVNHPFLYDVIDTVIHENECQYPELREKQAYITRVVRTEEENFAKTIDGGMKIFDQLLAEHKEKGETTFSGADAFKLYDTYGFPIDLTAEMLEEEGMTVDQAARHGGGQGDILLLAQVQNIAGHSAPPFVRS